MMWLPESGDCRTRKHVVFCSAVGALVYVALWLVLWLLGVWAIIPISVPFGVAGSAAIGAMTSPWRRLQGAGWIALLGAVCFLLVIAFTPVTRVFVPRLIRTDASSPGTHNAVVVLAGWVTADGLLGPEATDRMVTALGILRQSTTQTLVLTRPRSPLREGHRPDRAWELLLRLLPTRPNVIVIDDVGSTHDEAVGVRALYRTNGWSRVILVTSPLHTRRACATFERAGVAVQCTPSASSDIAVHALDTPNDRLAAFAMWLHESVGLLVYGLRGWI